MHQVIKCLTLFFFFVTISACERVINVDIDSVPKQYVIEGVITDNSNSCRVNISQTLDFNDSNSYKGVNGAVVTVSEDNRTPIRLNSSGDGQYRANIAGKPGNTYRLQVSIGGKTFNASSTMPAKVNLDTIYVTDRVFLNKNRKIATAEFTDPKGFMNNYRFVQYVDGRKENTIFVTNDNLIDGRHVVYELLIFGDDDYTLKKCDQVRIEMHCIDPFIYNFWFSLSQSSLGQSQSASPGNPATMFTNGALGYFSAHTLSVMNMPVSPDSTCSKPAN